MLEKPILYVASVLLLIGNIVMYTKMDHYRDSFEKEEKLLTTSQYELTMCNVSSSLKDNRLAAISGKIDNMQTRLDLVATSITSDPTIVEIETQPTPSSCDQVVDFLNKNLPTVRFQ